MLDSIDKRGLGLGYLFGTGISLTVGLFGYFLLTFEAYPIAVVGVLAALVLTATLPLVGYWLARGLLPNESIWKIATWSALGLGLSTLLAVGIIFIRVQYPSLPMFPSLLVNNVAAGGVLGVLFGTVNELQKHYEETVELNQHNSVMNRVLRHDIRNSMTVIIGYADHIASTTNVADHSTDRIKENAYDVVRLGNTARNIESILKEESGGTVDVADVVQSEVDRLRIKNPSASFVVDLPEDVRISVNELFTFVCRNLLEMTLEKSVSAAHLTVSVQTQDRKQGTFAIRLAADGFGADDWEQSVVFQSEETALRHEDGLEVWLVKWFTDHYGETIQLDEDETKPDGVLFELNAEAIESIAESEEIFGGVRASQ